jgi:hypothetical protein
MRHENLAGDRQPLRLAQRTRSKPGPVERW